MHSSSPGPAHCISDGDPGGCAPPALFLKSQSYINFKPSSYGRLIPSCALCMTYWIKAVNPKTQFGCSNP